jgi:hypothetical protein
MNLITFNPFNSCGMTVRKLMGSHRKSVTDFWWQANLKMWWTASDHPGFKILRFARERNHWERHNDSRNPTGINEQMWFLPKIQMIWCLMYCETITTLQCWRYNGDIKDLKSRKYDGTWIELILRIMIRMKRLEKHLSILLDTKFMIWMFRLIIPRKKKVDNNDENQG